MGTTCQYPAAKQHLLISRMHPVAVLVLVLPALVVCQGGGDDGMFGMLSVVADPPTDPDSSSCDPDLLPCTDDDDGLTCDCPSEEPREERSTGFRRAVMVRTNNLRQQRRTGPLRRDANLERDAQDYANFVTRGRTCRFNSRGSLRQFRGAVNRATGRVITAAGVVGQWWNTAGPRSHMLDRSYSRIGVGIAGGCKWQGVDAWIAVALYAA